MLDPSRRRNVAVVGPHHSGKTTLVEALLTASGAIPRRGTVADGTATTDYEPECIDRGGSTAVGFAFVRTRDVDLTLIDCPGFVDFHEETKLALLGADAAIVVIDAVPSRVAIVRPLVDYLDERRMPHCFFVNKLDRAGSDFAATLAELVAHFGKRIVAEQIPLGDADSYRGYVDLAENHAYLCEQGTAHEVPIEESAQAPAAAARARLLETLGDLDDRLYEELLDGVEPSLDEVRRDLHDQTCTDAIVPVLAGAGLTDIGVAANALLEVIARQFPAAGGDAAAPLVAQVCKTYVNPQSGKLSVVRVREGTLGADATLVVANTGQSVRAAGLYRLQGKRQESIASAGPGEIVAVGRLEGVRTGETLCADASTAPRAIPDLDEPLFALAIAPKEKLDEAKLSAVLARVLEEDPTLRVRRAEFTSELLLLGIGEVHVATTVQRIARKYRLDLITRPPAIAYRETISAPVEVRGRYKHQTGGHGQFGDVLLRIEPRERGWGVTFSESIVGGVVPKSFFPAIEKGVREALARGPLAGYPVVDLHVTLIDGSYHSVDSSEASFRTAAGIAIRDGVPKCAPQLLEPIERIEAIVPDDCVSSVLGGLTGKRGTILSFEPAERAGFQRVVALAPEAHLVNYITELRTSTRGLGTYTRAHARFDIAPTKLAAALASP